MTWRRLKASSWRVRPAGAVRRLEDFVGVLLALVAFVKALGKQLRIPANGHQQVVEVMRHASRQAADRLHLLGLPKLLVALLQCVLGLLALGDVADDGGERQAVGPAQRRYRKLAWKEGAVFLAPRDLDGLAQRQVVVGGGGERRGVPGLVRLRNQHHQRLAQHFVLGIAEHVLGAAIPERDVAVLVGGDDRVARRLRDRGEPLVGRLQPVGLVPQARGHGVEGQRHRLGFGASAHRYLAGPVAGCDVAGGGRHVHQRPAGAPAEDQTSGQSDHERRRCRPAGAIGSARR
jgi:hypothetical protein